MVKDYINMNFSQISSSHAASNMHGQKKSTYIHTKKNPAGAFQSDALLVPEHCLFDHIHNQTKCWDFDQWNRTASNACQERGMKVKSFAMLLPCGIDVFSGVEFVCCPSSKAASTTKKGWHSVAFCPFLSGPFYVCLPLS